MNLETNFDKDKLPYRSCVGIALFNKHGHVFVGERIDAPGGWQMPQGGIDENEDILAAAHRELAEETGVIHAQIIKVVPDKLRYDVPIDLSMKHWGGQYRGQEQTWVAMRFMGEDNAIKLDLHLPQEFDRWQWVSLKDTISLVVPFKQEIYRQVYNLFKDIGPVKVQESRY